MPYELKDITKLALDAEPTELRAALDDVLAVKLEDALNSRREDVANQLFNGPGDDDDTSDDEGVFNDVDLDELDDEGLDDDDDQGGEDD